MRRDRARIHQPGVRRDQRDQIVRGRRARAIRVGQMAVDRRGERRSGPRIPGAGDRGLSDVAHLS